MTSEREQQLENALAQFLKPIRGILFEVVIKSLCGANVVRFDPTTVKNKDTIIMLTAAMRDVCLAVKTNPIQRPRPNEVGNDMESFVIQALKAKDLRAAAPKTKGGKGKSTGYPDIKITTDALPIYLEIKSYSAKNHGTTMRSFYLSPAEDPKVSEDGYHLLVGFEMVQKGDSYTPVAFEIVDLYGLSCDMKAEFQSDNKRVYQKSRSLVHVRV
jgi:hypothetical protein